MAIVVNKARPVAMTDTNRHVKYDDTNEADVHLSTANTDKLALFAFNLAMRTTDDRGNPDTTTIFDGDDLGAELVVNGNFNYNIDGWTPNAANSTLLSWDARTGIRVENGANAYAMATTTVGIPVTAGKTYEFNATQIEQGGGAYPLGRYHVGTSQFGSNVLVNLEMENPPVRHVINVPEIFITLPVGADAFGAYKILDSVSVREVIDSIIAEGDRNNLDGDEFPDTELFDNGTVRVTEDEDSYNIDLNGDDIADIVIPK